MLPCAGNSETEEKQAPEVSLGLVGWKIIVVVVGLFPVVVEVLLIVEVTLILTITSGRAIRCK